MVVFFLLSAVMIIGALGVVLLRQPVHAALSLVGTLLTLAATYITLHAQFLAAIQVIVYAGAIVVLFLFVIMLLNIEGDERKDLLPWLRPASYGVAAVAAAAIALTAFSSRRPLPTPQEVQANLLGGNAGPIGDLLFTEFMLPFQLVAVLLLVSIIGSVGLVQRRAETAARREAAEERELTRG